MQQSRGDRRVGRLKRMVARRWAGFWMRFAGTTTLGRLATRLASWNAPPDKERVFLAYLNPRGYVAPSATIFHADMESGERVFIDDRVLISQRRQGGKVLLGNRVCIYRDVILETGCGGSLVIGDQSSIHPRCQINAYVASIRIGQGVMIAPNCLLYSYDHGIAPDQPIRQQPLQSKGDIVVEDEVWLGAGVTVLSGVHIGQGAVVGAGSVVCQDVPAGAIAVGLPARVVKMRQDVENSHGT
jgi:acetyltransferase-like isoleucine patch superfamily enzyme